MKNWVLKYFFILICVVAAHNLYAQGEQKAIVFTGVVVGEKTTVRLPGAYIFIPKAGTGRLAGNDGSFTINVFPGDSIVYSYVGYKKQYQVIPRSYNAGTYSAIISLHEDVMMLSEVKIYPYSSEEDFKRALLAMKLPDQADRDALAKSTDAEYIKKMAAQVPNNAQTNYRNTMDQQLFGRESAAGKNFAPTFQFLNPFAWAKFIKSVKNGDLKPKEWRKELNDSPMESINKQDVFKNDAFGKP
ncbi:carboxypeptidase-like regulatory domain-containing protein [Dyadobacter sp. CY345]|uniref:carboxypeptidase-like regulatory domain-containing protein n=1 Tax=Dyadobacter sp. CY345 TaxID=2909335 RepID=UPI001F239AC4|nr:carboxypeptidase-like regulatory domain-containing protein [Dyadobacter sp. CY345]MCF2442635.1 carboxypeptidase-like regulatory domain-containing protein [Dyadobacter sp. CY345]